MKTRTQKLKRTLSKWIVCFMTLACCLLLTTQLFSQGAAINTSGNIADTSAILDVSSTTKGMLIPRMTIAQRNAIYAPAKGLQIYNLDCDNINCNTGTTSAPNWMQVFPSANVPGVAGSITGTATACQGQHNVSYSVSSIANATSYTWSYSGTGATISGSTNPMTINFSGSATQGNLTVMGSNICGNGLVSANYPVTVNPNLPASVSISASPSGAICVGSNVTFTATPINGGSAPSYQWQLNGINVGSGSTYSNSSLANGNTIACIMTSNATCVTGSPTTSNAITMTVDIWLSGWNYRKKQTITGSTGGSQTNYQIKMIIHKGSGTDTPTDVYCGGNCRDDFGDIRWTKDDKVTPIHYWIESITTGNYAVSWIEIPSIPASPGTIDCYLYYGNSSAASLSSGVNTFIFFDDFASIFLNPEWTFVQSGSGGDSYSLTANPGKIRIVGSKQTCHDVVTLLERTANAGNYVAEVLMTGTWNANYYTSGIHVGDGIASSSGNRIVGQVMHESSVSPHDAVWTEKRESNARTVAAAVRFIEPTYPSDILMRFTKLGTDYTASALVAGSWVTGTTLTYATNSTKNGIVINNDDGINTFTADFDDFRIRNYISPEPTWNAWGGQEICN